MAKLMVDIPDQILPMLGKEEKDICQEILYRVIATLYWQEELSLGKSAELCGLPYVNFLDKLSKYKMGIKYDLEDLEQDIETIRKLRSDKAMDKRKTINDYTKERVKWLKNMKLEDIIAAIEEKRK